MALLKSTRTQTDWYPHEKNNNGRLLLCVIILSCWRVDCDASRHSAPTRLYSEPEIGRVTTWWGRGRAIQSLPGQSGSGHPGEWCWCPTCRSRRKRRGRRGRVRRMREWSGDRRLTRTYRHSRYSGSSRLWTCWGHQSQLTPGSGWHWSRS